MPILTRGADVSVSNPGNVQEFLVKHKLMCSGGNVAAVGTELILSGTSLTALHYTIVSNARKWALSTVCLRFSYFKVNNIAPTNQ